MTLVPGTTLGPYNIVSQLGSGGMGIVYQAEDPRLKRTVAIKLLSPDLTRDETTKQRFWQEAQAASALDHPNICTIYDIGETSEGQLEREPSRLVVTQGLSALMNFAWSDADTEAFIRADPRHAALEERVNDLRRRNDEHPDWPALRQYFHTDLTQSQEYQTLLRDFTEQQETVSAMLDNDIP